MNKREEERRRKQQEKLEKEMERIKGMSVYETEHSDCTYTVSYTHLTLPTNREV